MDRSREMFDALARLFKRMAHLLRRVGRTLVALVRTYKQAMGEGTPAQRRRFMEAMAMAAPAYLSAEYGGKPCKCRTCLKASGPYGRAHLLLHENLSPAERWDHIEQGFITVIGGVTGHSYTIDSNGRVLGFCINPTTAAPAPDRILAMKLLIETDEKVFLTVANSNLRTSDEMVQTLLDERWGSPWKMREARRRREAAEQRLSYISVGRPVGPMRLCPDQNCQACAPFRGNEHIQADVENVRAFIR